MAEFSGPSKSNDDDKYQTSRNGGEGDASVLLDWTSYTEFASLIDNSSIAGGKDDKTFTIGNTTKNVTGGTNWQAGIRQGNILLGTADQNAKKYVVFLTDGVPTFRYGKTDTDAISAGNGYTYGTGSDDSNSYNYNSAVNEYNASSNLTNSTARYVVNVGSDSSSKCNAMGIVMKATGETENGSYHYYLDGTTASNLTISFNTIGAQIAKPAYTNVVIEDKLSNNVRFASSTPEIRVYKTPAGGTESLLVTSDYTIDATKLLSNIVSVTLLNGAELGDGDKYRVEFDVIPTDSATTAFFNGQDYNGTGDSGTDADAANPISSNQQGFWSNDNDNTILSYKINGGGTTQTVNYQKPVFQVETTKYSVKKEWSGTTAETVLPDVQAKLTAKADINGTATTLGTDYISLPAVTLNADNSWTYIWSNLPKYYYYYDTEGNATHSIITYSADEVSVPSGYTKALSESTIVDPNDATATIPQIIITNTVKPYVDNTTLGEPDHNKTIKVNAANLANGVDSYTISLDVTGKIAEAKPIDILLILDISGSMKYNLGEDTIANNHANSRIAKVHGAIQTLVTTLQNATDAPEIRISMVVFSSNTGSKEVSTDDNRQQTSYGDARELLSWTSLDEFSTLISDNGTYSASNLYSLCGGGTNWQAGIHQGNLTMGSDTQANARKYFVFLTDGFPTFRFGTDANGNLTTSITAGTGNSDSNDNNYNAAKTEYNNSAALKATAGRYVVNCSSASAGKCEDFADVMLASGNGTNSSLDGTSATELQTSFGMIATSILHPAYTNVVIEDKLSEYVRFAETNPTVHVYATPKGGTETPLDSTQFTVDAEKLKQNIVSVSILNGGQLGDGVKYRVAFDVIPTDSATTAFYNGREYNGVGDANTDDSSNKPQISNGMNGFWSNDNDNTFLSYTVNSTNKTTKLDYQKPVFPVETTKYSVKKEWVGTVSGMSLPDVKVQLSASAKINGTLTTLDSAYISFAEKTLNASNNWANTWTNLPKYYYYINQEGKAAHSEIEYSVDEVSVPSGFSKTITTGSISDPTDPAATEQIGQTVITNTKILKLEVLKVDSKDSSTITTGAKFKLKDEDENFVKDSTLADYEITTGKDGTGIFEGILPGTYTLVETEAPVGYTVAQPIKITIGYDRQTYSDISKTYVIKQTVSDSAIYSLPDAGGIGTYLFTISGVAILMTALLLFIKNRRKEAIRLSK